MRRFGYLLPLALFACSPAPRQAHPALWRIEDGHGHEGWLFGTIHSSDRPLEWRTPAVDGALKQSGAILVEVGNLADEADVAATFARLARSEGEPPLSRRVAAKDRPALAALLEKSGHADGDFAAMDTWAAALTLARAGSEDADARNGVDRAVIASAGRRPVVELEGAAAQLGLFDALPESEQRDLLAAVVAEAAAPDRDLAGSWRTGDMKAIEQETRSGLLADPELREVLFTGRNRRWSGRIAQALEAGQKPFVAVGAAHMAGPQGLPAMLTAQGLTVTRVE
ncbi:TraB/GumN family protein [Novosphingobium sp. BL-52-GroH]|uniref:TraB/GumN family protein n=1 Tax=Novosphingobium sp. BL-52-GroH TaxID=3349877 RepID=UPI00384BDCC5